MLYRKFTLVELLCAVSIVVILCVLLLLTVGKVRERASRTTNINNLKQLSYAMQMYMIDNDGFLPYVSKEVEDSRCLFLLLPYTDYTLEVFYPPSLFRNVKTDPDVEEYIRKPELIMKHVSDDIGLSYYPGYAYSATDNNGRPYFDSKIDARMPIVTNINGTYPDTVYILKFDGSVLKVNGKRANDSVFE